MHFRGCKWLKLTTRMAYFAALSLIIKIIFLRSASLDLNKLKDKNQLPASGALPSLPPRASPFNKHCKYAFQCPLLVKLNNFLVKPFLF